MPLSTAVRDRCRAFLPDGEQLRYVFPATSLWTGRGAMMPDFIVAVSDSQGTVLGCRWFRRNRPSSVWATYPRGFRLGPVELYGSLPPTVTIGHLLLEVDEEYVPVIRAADAEIFDLLPPDPLPYL
jgi:hypothetical protein